MKYTNKHKLPKVVVQAVKQVRDDYSSGGSNISASGILTSPRIYWLKNRHRDELKQDVADAIWSLIGTAVHFILEKSAEYVDEARAEERLFKKVKGWLFSGQYDLVEGKVLSDYKITSVWSVIKDHKLEWEAQANCNRLLLHEHGVEIDKLQIVAILRDWSQAKAKIDSSYPQTQVKRVELPLWTLEETDKFLEDRITELQSHEDTPDAELPICSEEERWARPTTYAAIKKGGKRATKVFEDPLEAEIFAKQKGLEVEVRPGEDVRCLSYCDVACFCNYAKEKGYV